ncbi:unnamed protein product [Polarella glacialis]|uniref:AMP-dependent synthetase/ligase domain-containing protein n=1 Tax=Polarella glacialis TaxID=89957 RepID=A0A813JF77_POLGL|nr:unnamed protein product [Polarella glacialis]
MLKDSGAIAVVRCAGDSSTAQLAKSLSLPLVTLPADGQPNMLQVEGNEKCRPVEQVYPETTDMALLIYTSGTTGIPKGIIYDHAHLLHGVFCFGAHCEVNPSSVTLLKSPYFWAVIEWEMFPALIVGAKMVVASANGHKSPEYIANTINTHSVDVFVVTPSVFDLVLDFHEGQGSVQPLKSLKHVVTVGEPLPCSLANRAVAMEGMSARVHNFYGASESSCTIYTVPREGIDLRIYPNQAPAGRPQPHASVHLMRKLDSGFIEVPRGEEGEICFGGVSAAGYWHRDELTREKWVDMPGVGRVYRTGDLGRWTAGQLEVFGRLDRQVKIRGVRIEPEEIEWCLKNLAFAQAYGEKQTALKTVAVVATPEPADLVAFADIHVGVGKVTADQLKEHCKANLSPAYVPKYFVVLNDFPRLPNGKLDLLALQKLAKEHADEAVEVVMDSLGQMKALSQWAIAERQVVHRCYAFWMLGVLTDHFCRCGFGCHDSYGEPLRFCGTLASTSVPPWIEVMVRAVGNNQAMLGFIMLGAYQDSAPAAKGARTSVNFGKKDFFVFFVYLLMACPIVNVMDLIEDTRHKTFEWNYVHWDWGQSNHRWYLLMTFAARLFMQVGEWLRIPGLIQSLVIVLFLVVPNGSLDLCSCESIPDWGKFLLTLMFRKNTKLKGKGFCPIFVRWFSSYSMFYVWSFHFLRPLVERAKKHLPSGPTWAALSLSASMCLGVAAAMYHYPCTAVEDGTHINWLPFELLIGCSQPIFFALAMTHCPFDMAWWGNTSLGCYVFHFYFRNQMSELVLAMAAASAFDPTGLLFFMMILTLCIFIQSTIGPLGHYFLMGLQWLPESVMKLLGRSSVANH